MNKYFTHSIAKFNFWLVLFCPMLFLFINSCKKDENPSPQQELEQITSFYLQNVNTTTLNPFGTMLPNWDKVYQHEQNGQIIYEIALTNPTGVTEAAQEIENGNLAAYASKNNIRLLIFRNRQSGQIEMGCYMSIVGNDDDGPDLNGIHYKEPGTLNGKISYFDLNGRFANGRSYTSGKITETLSAGTREAYLANAG